MLGMHLQRPEMLKNRVQIPSHYWTRKCCLGTQSQGILDTLTYQRTERITASLSISGGPLPQFNGCSQHGNGMVTRCYRRSVIEGLPIGGDDDGRSQEVIGKMPTYLERLLRTLDADCNTAKALFTLMPGKGLQWMKRARVSAQTSHVFQNC